MFLALRSVCFSNEFIQCGGKATTIAALITVTRGLLHGKLYVIVEV